MDAQEARSRLEQMLRELDSTTTTLQDEHAGDTSTELTTADQHPADTASEISDGDREGALLEHVEAQRQQVRAALLRLDDGSFGTCIDCGKPIGEDRLTARPEAARCVQDQGRHEAQLAG